MDLENQLKENQAELEKVKKELETVKKEEAKAKGIRISYKDQLNKIGTFGTVEDFWAHYVHMKRPSELPVDTNVYLFRDGCHPSWEVRRQCTPSLGLS